MVHIVLLPSLGMVNGCVSMGEASRYFSHIHMHASTAVSLLPYLGFVRKFGFLQKKKTTQRHFIVIKTKGNMYLTTIISGVPAGFAATG